MASTNFLQPEDRAALTAIAAGAAPWNQRARALLALDNGHTEQGATELSGLRDTQVRYWVKRFENGGLAVFNPAMVEEEVGEVSAETPPAPTTPEPDVAMDSADVIPVLPHTIAIEEAEQLEAISAVKKVKKDKKKAKKTKKAKKKKSKKKSNNATKAKKKKGKNTSKKKKKAKKKKS